MCWSAPRRAGAASIVAALARVKYAKPSDEKRVRVKSSQKGTSGSQPRVSSICVEERTSAPPSSYDLYAAVCCLLDLPPTGVTMPPCSQATVLSDELQSALDSLPSLVSQRRETQRLTRESDQQKEAVFYADIDGERSRAESAYTDLEYDLGNVGLDMPVQAG